MSNDTLLTDDYVADLLVKEANDRSLRYSAMGLEAFNTTSKPTSMPKPNTKFLRHIIKDTDSHNKALLAKEAAESRARLKDLERVEEAKQRRSNPDSRDIRRRQLGDIQSILGGKRQRSGSDEKPASEQRRSRRRESRDGGSRKSLRRDDDLMGGDAEGRREYGRLSRREEDERPKKRRSHRDDEGRRSKRNTHDYSSSDEESSSRHHRHRSKRDRSRSPRSRHRHRSRSPPREKRSKHRHRSPLAQEDSHEKKVLDDSDPLEDLIGPAPPPKYRGRGTVAGAAGIDMRFSEFYDPKTDVMPDDEQGGGTWDDAIEAYRDRQKLRQNQESRMRAAGFEDREIRKLNASSTQRGGKTEEDVVWSKAGERREWDRGKSHGGGGGDDELRGIFSEDT